MGHPRNETCLSLGRPGIIKVMRRPRGRRQAGFTLIEVMFVVVLIAILAAIAVPAFTEEANKGKATSEVSAMFAQLSLREEQYKVDNNTYLSVAVCPATTHFAADVDVTAACTNIIWLPLRVSPPTAFLYCQYQVFSGTGPGTANATVAGNVFTFTSTSPPGAWYYLTAICDMNGDGTFSTYITSSWDPRLQKAGEGG
jgi:prepilin-type N-terminal cleavage/methylation domain-containing protein